MAHIPHTTLKELIQDVMIEDHKVYLNFITKINKEAISTYSIREYLLTQSNLAGLTDNQIELLKAIRFIRGGKLHLYPMQGNRQSPEYYTKWCNIVTHVNTTYYRINDIDITVEQLPFVSNYIVNQWKKTNVIPSKRKVRGTGFTFAMDEFSLTVFKNNITKPFLRNEAKNLVITVNKAYKEAANKDLATHVRNKYYAIILDNTEVHTKTMLSELLTTQIDKDEKVIYIPEDGEALVVELGSRTRRLASVSTSDAYITYSSDIPICTHMKIPADGSRIYNRALTAASIIMSASIETSNNIYKELSDRLVRLLPTEYIETLYTLTQSSSELNKITQQ